MADKTCISWTDATWDPIVGCSVVSPGCTNAMRCETPRALCDAPKAQARVALRGDDRAVESRACLDRQGCLSRRIAS